MHFLALINIQAAIGKISMSRVVNSWEIMIVFIQSYFYETFQSDRGLRVEHCGLWIHSFRVRLDCVAQIINLRGGWIGLMANFSFNKNYTELRI
jgi:hypothetical protein